MVIEYVNNETIIRIPESVKFNYLQKFIDYIDAISIINKSKAKEEEVDKLAEEVQSLWWKENKNSFIK